MVEKYKITQIFTAPTVIRVLKDLIGDKELKYDLNSLKLLGSVGEPLNAEAYGWYKSVFNNTHVVDCYWQTETGGIIVASLKGDKPTYPECAGSAMPGINVKIVEYEDDSAEPAIDGVLGGVYIENSWPGIARTILNDYDRYHRSYFSSGMYFTGDLGILDKNNDIWIRGRADDIINVNAHKISTAEVESATCKVDNVVEAAVVSMNHKIKGECIVIFCVLSDDNKELHESTTNKIKHSIRSDMGGYACPDHIYYVPCIPKTATGKIMRRVLRIILKGEKDLGDLSTCINKDNIGEIIQIVNK